MNKNIERVLDELDEFWVANEMTYDAYSRLHDSISELDDLLKSQEPRLMTWEELSSLPFDKGRVHRWAEKVYKEGNEREWKVVGHCNPLGWMYEQIIKSIDPLKTDCPVCSEAQREDEAASDMRDYCERYEPTYNPEDGSM